MDPNGSPSGIGGGSRGVIARNLGALYVIRLTTSVLPLVSIPYVVRILGPAGYGIYAFAQGLIGYFNMLIDYGFNLAATRRVAACRADSAARDRVVAATLGAKLLLAVLGLLLLLVLTATVPPLRAARPVILLHYGQVLGNALFPLWLYQGEERMVISSALTLSGALLATAAIFVVVNDPGDYVALAGAWGGFGLLTGAVALLVALRRFRVRLRAPSAADVAHGLRDGMLLSVTAGSTTLYTSGNAFLLGLLAPREVVGFYSAGEKIVRAVQELVNPIQQALYPRLAALAGQSRERALSAARRIIGWTAGLGLVLSIGIFVAAELVVQLVLGDQFARTVQVIRLLSPLPFLVALSATLTFQVMLPFGRDRALVRIVTLAGVTNVLIALLLAPRRLESGMALAVLTAEVLVLAGIALYLRSRGLRLPARSPDAAQVHPLGVAVDEP